MPKSVSSSKLVGGGGAGGGISGIGGYRRYQRVKQELYQSGDYPASVPLDANLNRISDVSLMKRELSLEYMVDRSYAKLQDLTNPTVTGLKPKLNRTGKRILANEQSNFDNLVGALTETKKAILDRGYSRGYVRPGVPNLAGA